MRSKILYFPNIAERLGGKHATVNSIRGTLVYLRACIARRAEGYSVSYTTDPAWLVMQAVNRRGGYVDNPGSDRGSCRPVRRNANKACTWGESRDGRRVRRGSLDLTAVALYGTYPALEYPCKAVGSAVSRFPKENSHAN